MKEVLTLFLSFSVGLAYSQVDLHNVDLSRIEQKKVRKLLKEQQARNIGSFSELSVSVNETDDLEGFHLYEKIYIVKEYVEFVWSSYELSSQSDIWDLNKISFALLYSRANKSLKYANEDTGGLQNGQIFYLNLKILNGFYSLPVAFEIMNVDAEQKVIEFSYLEGGKARGKQTIKLESTEEGFTRIIHKSVVKSKSKIRDKYLYPYFHNKLINEFHSNMRRLIARQAKSGAGFFAASQKE